MWSFSCIELNVDALLHLYIWEDLQDWRKPGLNLITSIKLMDPWYSREKEERKTETQKNFDPKKAREERINAIKWVNQYLRCEFESEKYLESIKAKHKKELDIEVPLDPRFID